MKRKAAYLMVFVLAAGVLSGCASNPAWPTQSSGTADASGTESAVTVSESDPSSLQASAPDSIPAASLSSEGTSSETGSSAAQEQPTPAAKPQKNNRNAAGQEAAEKEGYTYIGGQTFKADILHNENFAPYMYAAKVSFGDGYLTYDFHDFDLDGTDEMLLLTVQKDQTPVTVTNSWSTYSYDAYDFRLHMFEPDASGKYSEASQIQIQVPSLPVDVTCDFFYKDYEDKVGIFYNLDGYEWTDDGGSGALVEYGYSNGSLQVLNDTLSSFPGDTGYIMDPEAIRESMGDEAAEAFNSFGFRIVNTGYQAPMIMDQDVSCIRLSRIASTAAADEEMAAEDSGVDLTGALTYYIYDCVKH